MTLQLSILALLWLVFFVLHSVLADQKVKTFFYTKYPAITRFYRLLYNIISVLTILPAMYYQMTIYSPRWFYPQGIVLYMAYFLMFAGIAVMFMAFKNYQTSEFIGTLYLKKTPHLQHHSISGSSLATSGLNALVRHPLYFGILLSLIGLLIYHLSSKTLITGLIFFVYLIAGTYFEEKKLIQEFGEAYIQYRKKVKMLIPYIF